VAVFSADDSAKLFSYGGANVENASYGLTICAERVAICNGITAGHTQLISIAISTLNSDNKPVRCFKPCGACLQFIAEFGAPNTEIIIDGDRTYTLRELLPHGFTLP
jgi:cytidine deaminase